MFSSKIPQAKKAFLTRDFIQSRPISHSVTEFVTGAKACEKETRLTEDKWAKWWGDLLNFEIAIT